MPGVHASGIDEPRLVGFARDIAATGHPVLTVELPDLARYEITTRSTDMIEDAAAWMMRRAEFTGGDGRIGMLGISFGGGLSIVASARPAIRNGVAFVMAFGGHADLPRTLKYLCTGIQSDGKTFPPHDYGLAIVLHGAADRVVPAGQAPALRAAILSFLEASRLDMVDKAKSHAEFERAKTLATTLAEPSRTYMGYVNARDVARLARCCCRMWRTSAAIPRSPPTFRRSRRAGVTCSRHRGQRRPRDRVHAARGAPARARRARCTSC